MWYDICQCGYDVRGDDRQLFALCNNPNPGRSHQVRRPNCGLDQRSTPEAVRIYRLLDHKSLQAFESTDVKNSSRKNGLNHGIASIPITSFWNKQKAASVTNKLQDGNRAPSDPEASPLYWQVISNIQDRQRDLIALKDALWRFYTNIVPEERFIFEVRRRELEAALVECLDWLSNFYHRDDGAHGWRIILHEKCKNEDERRVLAYAHELFEHDIERLQLSEIRDLDVLLRGRVSNLKERTDEVDNGRARFLFEEGERILHTFFQKSAAVMRLVEIHISMPDGAPDLHWFREQRSGRIRFTAGG